MGFFTGFFPTGKNSSRFSYSQLVTPYKPEFSPKPIEVIQPANTSETQPSSEAKVPEDRPQEKPSEKEEGEEGEGLKQANLVPRKLVIIVTPISTRDMFRGALLRRLANTIGLVPPPLVWIVVEAQTESNEVNEIMRKTGIMYRHLVFKENFTDTEAELDHQRNVALKHIEQHRLSGIVHFAGLSNVYDLEFFDELRKIEYAFSSLLLKPLIVSDVCLVNAQ